MAVCVQVTMAYAGQSTTAAGGRDPNVIFTQNQAGGFGGAISFQGDATASLDINNVEFQGNKAPRAGALFLSGTTRIIGSSFIANQATVGKLMPYLLLAVHFIEKVVACLKGFEHPGCSLCYYSINTVRY